MKTTIFILLIFMVIVNACILTYFYIDFKRGCEDYLKIAGDAPNIERANQYLGHALDYIEANKLTVGNTAIFFDTPDCDLSIWHEQLLGAKQTTDSILARSDVTQLEKDNALMKLREVILDDGSSGAVVTCPNWITWYPKQGRVLLWIICAWLGLIIYGLYWLN